MGKEAVGKVGPRLFQDMELPLCSAYSLWRGVEMKLCPKYCSWRSFYGSQNEFVSQHLSCWGCRGPWCLELLQIQAYLLTNQLKNFNPWNKPTFLGWNLFELFCLFGYSHFLHSCKFESVNTLSVWCLGILVKWFACVCLLNIETY